MLTMENIIGFLYIVREKIRSIDTEGFWDYYCPGLRNDESVVCDWEKNNNSVLPDAYRKFLLAANGWKCVVQDFDLYGIQNLSLDENTSLIERRNFCIDNLNNVGDKNLLLPIGGSDYSEDLFLLVLDSSSKYYGYVIWTAGEEVERHQSFEEFLLALVEYNKLCYERMTGEKYID